MPLLSSKVITLSLIHILNESGKEVYIAIDEFQQIAEYPEKGTEALLRIVMSSWDGSIVIDTLGSPDVYKRQIPTKVR